MIRRLRLALAGAAVVATLVGGSAAASAGPPLPSRLRRRRPEADPEPGGGVSPSADGRLYAWRDASYSGHRCSWVGDDAWWGDAPFGSCNDETSSLWNNGYVHLFDDVLHRDIYYGGPALVICRGSYYGDLSLGREYFSNGRIANDQISSHYWFNGNGWFYGC